MNILILHGWNLSGDRYANLASLLKKKGHRVFTPDMPGFGKAENPEKPYTLKDYGLYVLTYLKKNNVDNPIMIGHSFGGRVAIYLTSNHPELFSKLILTGVPGVPPVASFKVKTYVLLAKMGGLIFTLPILNKMKDTARKALYRSAQASDYYRAEGVMRGTFKNIIAEDLIGPMKRIKTKTYLVWGEDDTITPVQIAHKMKTIIKGSELSIAPKLGHSFIYKQPKQFVQMIEKHII